MPRTYELDSDPYGDRDPAGAPDQVIRAFCEESGWQASARRLAGLVYLGHALSLRLHARRLVDETFRATDEGPTLPTLRSLAEAHGFFAIPKPKRTFLHGLLCVEDVRAPELDGKALDIVARITSMTRAWDNPRIESVTMASSGPWSRYRVPGRDVPLPDVAVARWGMRVFLPA